MTTNPDAARLLAEKVRCSLTQQSYVVSCQLADHIDSLTQAIAAETEAKDRGREALAKWMIMHSYATGHGDSIEDLLGELGPQHDERIEKAQAEAAVLLSAIKKFPSFSSTVTCSPDNEYWPNGKIVSLDASELDSLKAMVAVAPLAAAFLARHEAMREALKPFVRMYEDTVKRNEGLIHDEWVCMEPVSVGDLRYARTALNGAT